MLTPQEVSERAFSKASFGGYNMSMVDEFLDILTQDYTILYKENATLKGKMKVLADKVEEYRSTEDAMRKTLMTAQRMADSIVAEAETKKADLLFTTEQAAKARTQEISQQLRDEEERLTAIKARVANYVSSLQTLYQHEMEYLSGLSAVAESIPQPEATTPTPVESHTVDLAQEISAAVERAVAEEPAPAPVEPAAPVVEEPPVPAGGLYTEIINMKESAPAPQEEDISAATQRIDFNKLQFGKDYEIR